MLIELQAIFSRRSREALRLEEQVAHNWVRGKIPTQSLGVNQHILETTFLSRPIHGWGADDLPQH